jgi:large subunit ribosomal protein L12e
MAKDLKGTVKEVRLASLQNVGSWYADKKTKILGTAFSVGCQVEGRSPKEISDEIESGEIESMSTSSKLLRNLLS